MDLSVFLVLHLVTDELEELVLIVFFKLEFFGQSVAHAPWDVGIDVFELLW